MMSVRLEISSLVLSPEFWDRPVDAWTKKEVTTAEKRAICGKDWIRADPREECRITHKYQ